MYKACSRCGKIHDTKYICKYNAIPKAVTDEARTRSKNSWTVKSLTIREQANWLCEVCRDKGVYTYEGLEVHHIDKIKDRPDKTLDNSNLICLCVTHHKQADAGQLSKEYLLKLVGLREER